MRRGEKPTKAKVKAKPPIARKARKSEGSRVHDLEKHLAEALKREAEAHDQQTATAEILRVISRSPGDMQPVFDAIVRSADRLCNGLNSAAYLFDGELIHHVALSDPSPEAGEEFARQFPQRPNPELGVGRVVLTGAIAHSADVLADPHFGEGARRFARLRGFRALLLVPMLRAGRVGGVISVGRAEPGLFPDSQVQLLQTFADQAVIAIENSRLFTETKEALEQQTATSEILRVISSSPTDVQPVFDTIVQNAVALCDGLFGAVNMFDGEMVQRTVADHNYTPAARAAVQRMYPMRPSRQQLTGRAILSRSVAHLPDVLDDPEYAPEIALAGGWRGALAVPMLREGHPIGTILVTRAQAGPFSERHIELLKTFADQAVIAIENVRLFNETKEALEQQTATADILRVISTSPTDLQPVLDAVVKSAARFCGADDAELFRLDGEHLKVAAHHGPIPAPVGRLIPIVQGSVSGRAFAERRAIHVADLQADAEEFPVTSRMARELGFRASLSVPLLREGTAVGTITLRRAEVNPFTDKQVALLKTFADQAVIAIENVRLFKELQARTSELTRSVDQLTALGEISQAVSSTLDVETVLQTIVFRASQLAGADGCAIYEYDEATEAFHIRATHNLDPALFETLRAAPLRKGEGAMGRAAETREPTQVADIAVPGAYQSHIRDTLLGAGYRALLSVPLLREGEIIGSLSLNRHVPGEFPPEAVEVLKTFATQSALAIQNARLFREIADKSRQLEVASQHKSEFLANMSHELRTPLNAIIGFSEVLTERMFGELNEKQDEYLKDIHASGQHLLSLINDILDLSKIEAGRMELELADFDLPAAIDNALTLVRERAGRRGIGLHQAVDQRLGAIRADERKLKQVLLNLLSNAIKFTPEEGRIEVRAVPADESVEVSVTDTGVGIAPEDQEAVFEEFRQVGTAAKKVEGTGLGLALSRKFVELHGGRIWVTSQVGVGSTFAFTVPLTIRHQPQTG